MDAWIIDHLRDLIKALGMIAAGTGLVLYLLNRSDRVSGYQRTSLTEEPRE